MPDRASLRSQREGGPALRRGPGRSRGCTGGSLRGVPGQSVPATTACCTHCLSIGDLGSREQLLQQPLASQTLGKWWRRLGWSCSPAVVLSNCAGGRARNHSRCPPLAHGACAGGRVGATHASAPCLPHSPEEDVTGQRAAGQVLRLHLALAGYRRFWRFL